MNHKDLLRMMMARRIRTLQQVAAHRRAVAQRIVQALQKGKI
jgi:hypothetical protein